MEKLLEFICMHAEQAYLIFFFLLLLAGLNVPVSEDLLLIAGGAIACACIPEHAVTLYLWMYFGAWFSAWEAYAIGRILGPKLYEIRWFSRILTVKRIEKLHHYFEKFGILTFLIGRFFPGGVRNALFMTCGLGKMPFLRFILRDGFACIFSSATLFLIGYKLGQNYQTFFQIAKRYHHIFIGVVLIILLILVVTFWILSQKKDETTIGEEAAVKKN